MLNDLLGFANHDFSLLNRLLNLYHPKKLLSFGRRVLLYMIAGRVDFVYVSTNLDSYGTNKSNFIPDWCVSIRKMFIRFGGVIVF